MTAPFDSLAPRNVAVDLCPVDGEIQQDALEATPFTIVGRGDPAPSTPLVFASPHSGRLYPHDMMAASVLDADSIRRSEDVLVDDLVLGAASHGAVVITATYARAYIDVNREPYDLDPSMFEDELPAFARGRSARVAAGLGSIARIVAEGQEIYGRKLTFAEAAKRIETVHAPYHAALEGLIGDAMAAYHAAILIDWHSMPSAAARTQGQSGDLGRGAVFDLVLGDRFGSACAPKITSAVERELEAMGYRVARNAPYAGGYTTEFYGRPGRHVHALQIEINRALYMNETTLEPHSGFGRLKQDLQQVFGALAAMTLKGL
jgi:N-formylglutamate amidohydrolase